MATKRLGVLTFHRCINYGSYWQARCLVDGLRARGHDAVLLDHHSWAVTAREWRCAFQPALPERTERADRPLYRAKTRKFLEAFEQLPLSSPFPLDDPAGMAHQDVVVVGSDEVWNLSHPWYGGWPIFFGDCLNTDRVVAYAASLGNHDATLGFSDGWAERLRRFDAISVRDENSRAAVADILGKSPDLVLDPCLQFPPEVADDGQRDGEPPYILVYGHGFAEPLKAAVRRSADRSGLRLISVGYVNPWADEQRIDVSPEDFVRLVAGAEAVATNFFHGCVFSILYAKPFVCAWTPYRLNKVRDLTRSLGAEERLVSGVCEHEIERLLHAPLASEVAARVETMRCTSQAYLDRVLG